MTTLGRRSKVTVGLVLAAIPPLVGYGKLQSQVEMNTQAIQKLVESDQRKTDLLASLDKSLAVIAADFKHMQEDVGKMTKPVINTRADVKRIRDTLLFAGPVKPKSLGIICKLPKFGPFSMNE